MLGYYKMKECMPLCVVSCGCQKHLPVDCKCHCGISDTCPLMCVRQKVASEFFVDWPLVLIEGDCLLQLEECLR